MATNNMQMQTFVTQPDDAEIEGLDGYNGDLTGSVAATLGVNCGCPLAATALSSRLPLPQTSGMRSELRDVAEPWAPSRE